MRLQVTLMLICLLFPEAWPRGSPNGRKCYLCVFNQCIGRMDCVGDEDHCITMKNSDGHVTVTEKGCASKSGCAEHKARMPTADVSCCKGNLCNGAERVNLSLFLLILGPLLSFIPFSSLSFSVFF